MSEAIYTILTKQKNNFNEEYSQSCVNKNFKSVDRLNDGHNYNIDNKTINNKSSKTRLQNAVPIQSINIPIGSTLDKQTLLQSLGRACDFPDYYALNWDSAWDCLTDSPIKYLTLDLRDVNSIDRQVLATFKSIIEEAFNDFGKPQLWILLEDELI